MVLSGVKLLPSVPTGTGRTNSEVYVMSWVDSWNIVVELRELLNRKGTEAEAAAKRDDAKTLFLAP